MNDFYTKPLRPNEIYHFGIKRRSGRYPWGSGDRPYQSEDVHRLRDYEKRARSSEKTEARSEKNLEIGKSRLMNRLKVANTDVDRLSAKVGWRNTEKAGAANAKISQIKKATDEILASEERTRILGENYAEIQKRVDELMKGATGSKKSFRSHRRFDKEGERSSKRSF